MAGVVRLARLPEGTNTKEILAAPFPGVLTVAPNPENRYLTAEIVEDALPLADDGPGGLSARSAQNAQIPDDDIDDIDDINLPDLPEPVPGQEPAPGQGTQAARNAPGDPVLRAMHQFGMIQSRARKSAKGVGWDVICPWHELHTPGTGAVNTGTMYFRGGGFKCWHGHCETKGPADVRARMDELLRADSGGLVGLDDLDPNKLDVVDPAQAPPSPVPAPPGPVSRFRQDIVYLKGEDRWLNLRTGIVMNDPALNMEWTSLWEFTPETKKGGHVSPAVWARNSDTHERIDARTWWPGQKRIFTETTDGGGQRLVNGWKDPARPLRNAPWAWLDASARASPWWRLTEDLIGVATHEQRENVRRLRFYWSMIAGAPGEKPGHFPVFIGPEGAGKEHIWRPLLEWLGPTRSTELHHGDIGGTYNPWIMNKLVMLPEVRRTTRGVTTDHDMVESMKAILDRGKPFLPMRDLYKSPIQVRNVFVLVMTSNEDRPMSLAPGDRRFWVIKVQDTAALGWTPARHEQFAAWRREPTIHGGTNNDIIIEWLIRYWDADLMLGEMRGHAPLTQDKQDLIEQSGGPVLAWLRDRLRREPPDPLTIADIFTAEEMVNACGRAVHGKDEGLPLRTRVPSVDGMGRLLKQMGCRRAGGGVRVGTRRLRPWVRPDADARYDVMDVADIAREMEGGPNRRAKGDFGV